MNHDERSGGFYALGWAKAIGQPVVGSLEPDDRRWILGDPTLRREGLYGKGRPIHLPLHRLPGEAPSEPTTSGGPTVAAATVGPWAGRKGGQDRILSVPQW